MGQPLEKLAQFVANTTWDELPERVRLHAKVVLLDTIGVILAGSARPEVRKLRDSLKASGGSGATVYAAGGPTSDPRTAALLNGIAGRAIELCEGLRLVSGQAAVQILPGVLATAEHEGRTGKDVLTALILGYEVAGRLASAFVPRPLAHQNGQVSMFGAAAAGARVRGMSAPDVSRAIRVAAPLVLAPSYTHVVEGATSLNVAGAMSSFVGTLVPDLVVSGFESYPDAVEEALGQLVGSAFESEHLLDGLGARWHITRELFSPVCLLQSDPRCTRLPGHDTLEAAPGAGRDRAGRHRDLSLRVRHAQPGSAELLRVQIFVAACRRRDDRERPRRARQRRRQRPARSRDLESAAPRPHHRGRCDERGCAAAAPLARDRHAQGRAQETATRESHRGDFNEPFAESELREKFRELAGAVLTPTGTGELEAVLDRCENWENLTGFSEILRRGSRPAG